MRLLLAVLSVGGIVRGNGYHRDQGTVLVETQLIKRLSMASINIANIARSTRINLLHTSSVVYSLASSWPCPHLPSIDFPTRRKKAFL
jgi:hypothetical protein